MQRNYNNVYSKLVSSNDDLVGQVAYSLYKREKIEYISQKIENGTPLTDAELVPFNEISSTESSLESYRLKSEILLQGFIDNVLEEARKDIEQQAVEQQSQILKEVIKPLQRHWWQDVLLGVLSSFLVILLLALLAIIIKYKDTEIQVDLKTEEFKN